MLLPLDGALCTLKDKTVATAALDAGWLASTVRVMAPMTKGRYQRPSRRLHREPWPTADDLANFTVEWPDGSLRAPPAATVKWLSTSDKCSRDSSK
jgi:hypothetical protein